MDREWNDVERLAFAQALFKMAAKLVDTKDPDSLRAKVDRGYKELYEQTGSKSFDVMLNGQQVGTYSIRFSKPKQEEKRYSFEVVDYEKLARYFTSEITDAECRDFASSFLAMFAEYVFNASGEILDGCDVIPIITPATEKQYIGGVLKIDSEQVQEAVRDVLPQTVVGLLGGGDE